jgi:hypothetical protein
MNVGLSSLLDGYFAAQKAADVAAAEAYDRMKKGPVPSRDIHPRVLRRVAQFLGPNEVAVETDFGRLLHIETGVYDTALGLPSKSINCVNCGAPRPRASSVCCDYCGSHQ